jgi:hypothetical protein
VLVSWLIVDIALRKPAHQMKEECSTMASMES